MKAQTRARVKKIVAALKAYDPERVILFGSAARGDADEYSDIDIAVIKETSERFLDRLGQVYSLIKPHYALDVLVYTPHEFAEMHDAGNSFIEEILCDGIVVYERAKKIAREGSGVYDSSSETDSAQGGAGMRKTAAEHEGRRWLEQAQADLEIARWNEQGNFHSAACFWAQQTAERALKAFLYFHGKRRVTGHSVAELMDACAQLDKDFNSLADDAMTLDRYYIPTRYPNGLPGGVPAKTYKTDEAKAALQMADTVVSLVATKIGISPTDESNSKVDD